MYPTKKARSEYLFQVVQKSICLHLNYLKEGFVSFLSTGHSGF